MSNKFREALCKAYKQGVLDERHGPHGHDWEMIGEIAQRYGPFYNEEEVRVMLANAGVDLDHIEQTLSRHTEGESEPGEQVRQEIEVKSQIAEDHELLHALTKRVADLERKRDEWELVRKKGHPLRRAILEMNVRDILRDWENVPEETHTEGGDYACHLCKAKFSTLDQFALHDCEPDALHGDLIALTKRLAAIEKRVLADGHADSCIWHGGAECTCGHDDIQEATK